MLQISKYEVSSLLNLLRELEEGSSPEDLTDDIKDMIKMCEAILGEKDA